MESLRGFIGMACFGDHHGSKKLGSLRAVARIRFVRPWLVPARFRSLRLQ